MNVQEIVRNYENKIQTTMEYAKGYADGVNYWAALNPSKVDQSILVTEMDLLKEWFQNALLPDLITI